jgi:Carboxypeptidase regulatory-like domain
MSAISYFRRHVALCVLSLFVACALAQEQPTAATPDQVTATTKQPPAPPAVYSVSGMVVNSLTDEPIPRALVQVFLGQPHSVFTDNSGRFKVDGLPQGGTMVQAFKPGYFSPSELPGQQTTVAVGPQPAPVTIRLLPDGGVTGYVLDEEGEPIQFASVMAKCARVIDGRKRWQMCQTANTDEDGYFRISHLQPGDYYLVVHRGGVGEIRGGGRAENDAVHTGYGMTYYPPARTGSSQATFQVHAGAKSEVTIKLKKERLYKVSGNVSGQAPNGGVMMELLTPGGEQLHVGAQVEPISGTFAFKDVSAGQYTLVARQQQGEVQSETRIPLTIAGDLQGVAVPLQPAINILVKIDAEKTNVQRPNYRGQGMGIGGSVNPAFPYMQLRLSSGDPTRGEIYAQQDPVKQAPNGGGSPDMSEQPAMIYRNVPPGRYTLRAQTWANWYVVSATYDGADVLNAPLEIKAGVPAGELVVHLRDDGASIRCTVRAAAPESASSVLAIPESGGPAALGQATAANSCIMSSLAPGTYKLYSFDNIGDLEYANPDVMSEYDSRAAEVTLGPAEEKDIELELIHRSGR